MSPFRDQDQRENCKYKFDTFIHVCIYIKSFLIYRVIRYEDFCKDIKTNAKTLLQFFKFKMHPRVINFIESHTHENMGGVSSTFRDSKNAPYHWRNELNFSEVQVIQEKCSLAMELWGYRKANTQQELKELDPLMKYNL